MSRSDLSLPDHAADKVKRSLDDVLDLTDDSGEKLRIALMAASIPIGLASGILAAMMKNDGRSCTEAQAKSYIFKLLETAAVEGADATMSMLNRQQTTENP